MSSNTLCFIYFVIGFCAVQCYLDDDVRINVVSKADSKTSGIVEISWSDKWYPLSAFALSSSDAPVICRSANYNGSLATVTVGNDTQFAFYYFRYNGFHCKGSEIHLQECPSYTHPLISNGPDIEDFGYVVVTCLDETKPDTTTTAVTAITVAAVVTGVFIIVMVTLVVLYKKRYITCHRGHKLLNEDTEEYFT